MKYIILLTLFLTFITYTFAQKIPKDIQEDVKYRVFYQHEHLRDTSKEDQIYKENMLLLIGDNHSKFLSYDKLIEYITVEKSILTEVNSGNTNVKRSPGKIIIPDEIILAYNGNETLISTYLAKHLHYYQRIPEIHWTIQDSSKSIEGQICTYAKTHFLGRDWEVWFAPNIPIPSGPWFLKGLPGLILEASDLKKQVKYTMLRFESNNTENRVIDQLDTYRKIALTNEDISSEITWKEKNELLGIARKNIRAFRLAQQQVGEPGITFDYGITNVRSWITPISNPIDLDNL